MKRDVTLRIDESVYEQVMGMLRLVPQVEIASEGEARRSRRSGRPRQTGKPVVKAFCYGGSDKSARLMMLCQGLKALGWIDKRTDMQTFIDMFSGGDIRRRIVWTGPANTLAELFRRLVNERGLVTLPEKHSLWVMVNGHFWEKESSQEFGTDRLRNTHAPIKDYQTVAYMVNLLDPELTVDDIREMMESQR